MATGSDIHTGADSEDLQRISQLDTDGYPVLSIYLDLDPARFPTPSAREAQVGAVLDLARREAPRATAERVEAWLRADPSIFRGARSLAVFGCAEADVLEAVGLPEAVEPLVVVDTVPWLEPLAALISPGEWAVAVVSRRGARLFRGGPTGISEFATVHDVVHGRHAQGGWSQANLQRGVEEQVAEHVRGVALRLLRAHRRHRFEHLVVIAPDELHSVIERTLHSDLERVLAGILHADLEHAPADEIARAVAPVMERAERERERRLAERVDDALTVGGLAAAGLDEVLALLEHDRVETLLVAERADVPAGLCPRCGRLSDTDDGRCPFDGAALDEVDAVEHAVALAAQRSVPVVVMREQAEWLHRHGGFAALLRW